MKTKNEEIISQLKNTDNVVTRNSLENILLNRATRGDSEAATMMFQWLKGWIK